MRLRGGCKPTPDDHDAYLRPSPGTLALSRRLQASSVEDRVDLRPFVVEVLDQGNTNTCAAHAVAQAIRVLATQKNGLAASLPSRRYLYRDAVGYGHAHRGEPLVDQGTTFGDLFSATQWVGVVEEDEWPWDEHNVLKEPPLKLFREGTDRRWTLGAYVPLRKAQRVDDMKRALSLGHPCVVGVTIDEAFEDMDGPRVVRDLGPSVGGHAMCVVGFDADGVLLVNSWNTGYRDGGYVTLSWDLVASPRTMDAWSINVEPPRGVL